MDQALLLKKAQDDQANGDYNGAYLILLRLCLRVDDSMEAGSYAEMAAICLQKLGRNDEAIIWLERANMEQPNFPPYEEALEKAKRGEMISS